MIIPSNIILAAQKAYTKYNILPSVQLAQWALESGWGKHSPGNNPFGIKATVADVKAGHSITFVTHEQLPSGETIHGWRQFKTFKTIDEAFDYHANLLANGKPYISCRIYRSDWHMYCIVMGRIYATDHVYAQKLIGLITDHNLTQYDIKHENKTPIAAAITVGVGGVTAMAASNVQPVLHNFDWSQPLLFGGGFVLGTGLMILWAIVEHFKRKGDYVAIRPEAQPIIDAVTQLAAKAAAAGDSAQTISDLQAQLNQKAQDDADTDAALKAAAGMQ